MHSDDLGRVVRIKVEEEMKSSYLDYAMSVIIGRALPDVRDALKPVHRRILYTMYETGNRHNAPYKKSARIVGDVMGKYHPHGDAAIYDTIVRMAQDFNMRYPLVDGQGNFGSIDGDSPAAMRYTEVRLTHLAEEMLQDIDKQTVDFTPNYDGSLQEPTVLPAKVPNLLVNGAQGIAVGMSTNIPPHNLSEVCEALVALLRNPDLSVSDLMRFVPAPDFPTGGIIEGQQGVKKAYETGRGTIMMRAKAEIEQRKGERPAIVVTELPYQVNKARLLEHIAELHKQKRIEGIHDLRDESDRHGIRVVVELKRDIEPRVVLNQLYAHTALKTSFNVIMLAIVRGKPVLLSLKQALEEFLAHRREVVLRRTAFELNKAREREHVLLGFQVALDNLDAVIELIRASADPKEALDGLCENFGLSEVQAKAILDMKLERLTRLERDKILEELRKIREEISRLKSILESEEVLKDVVAAEIEEIKQKYGDRRRSVILEAVEELSDEDLIPREDTVVTVSAQGFIKRTPVSVYRSQRRAGKGKIGMGVTDEDSVVDMFVASTHDRVLFFTDKGRVFSLKVYQIPQGSRNSKGRAIVNVLKIGGDERVRAILQVKEFEDPVDVVFATKNGIVKRTALAAFRNVRSTGIAAIRLGPGDDLVSVNTVREDDEVLLFSSEGKSIRFRVSDIRRSQRASGGVRGMKLGPHHALVGMEVLWKGCSVLAVSVRGYGKRTTEEEYRVQCRGGTGVLAMRTNRRTGRIVGMRAVREDDELMLTTEKGATIRIQLKDIKVRGRVTQGVKLMDVPADDRVVALDIVVRQQDREVSGPQLELLKDEPQPE